MRIGERSDGSYIDTEPAKLNIEQIHHWLSTDAYWALGRAREQTERAIAGSLPFGLYNPAADQLGFARVVTDFVTFAWLCDVYIDRPQRGRGLGTWFIGVVCDHLAGMNLRRVLLATADAHDVYSRIGFTPLTNPERWMERRRAT